MATDEGHLYGEGPVTVLGVEIGVADARVLDIDEDLIGAGLLDVNLLVDASYFVVSIFFLLGNMMMMM